jgi:6-methylsalicylate decarboxylase
LFADGAQLDKMLPSHADGFLPYTAHRFAELRPGVHNNVPPTAELLKCYFDTALFSGPAALTSLPAFARVGRIL